MTAYPVGVDQLLDARDFVDLVLVGATISRASGRARRGSRVP